MQFGSTEIIQKHCQRHNGPKALSTLTQSTPLVESRSFNKIIKSWSNFSLVWFGKGRETLRSPRNNLLPCGCQQDSRRYEASTAAPSKWVRGQLCGPCLREAYCLKTQGTASQQEELRGDGEKVKVVLILSLLLFFINLWKCLRRAGGRKYSQ